MALSWNEIKDRAVKFSLEWKDATDEDADAKPFLIDFFDVFGTPRKKVASFEHRVKKLGDYDGYIDMLWKGTLLVEMKSRGKNLAKAYHQAIEYLHGLNNLESPRYILVCDFHVFQLFDLESDTNVEFTLPELVNNVHHFGFIAGYQKREFKEQDPVNIKAAELMGKLHDKLKSVGYEGHPLEVFLVRLLFILFADDTTIFDKDIFMDFIVNRTSEDGSDIAARLSELFYILNTPKEKRLKNIDEDLNNFPYVNGKLFEEFLPPSSFDKDMRNILMECGTLDWGKISPSIFGSMFQSVMNPVERRKIGAHYTSEKNILKVIKPLFLDELWAEFESIKGNRSKLIEFHNKLSKLKFLDPACGCGNFLVITYRELRLLEIEILRELNKTGQRYLDISEIILLDVDMMYGIELEEFPARIAEVAMWLIDHQMNMLVSNEFGQYFARLPLRKAANIVNGNALQINWENIIPKYELSYILGNPPFIGHQLRSTSQMNDMEIVFQDSRKAGRLDYVAAWYVKAAQLIKNTKIKVCFVSTNSITQGEQAGILWKILLLQYNIKIHFAHRTFNWSNEAKGSAAVHCVIIGFANYDTEKKVIFEYEDIKGEPHEISAKNINPYLTEAKDFIIDSRSRPIHGFPEMSKGSQPTDGGFLLLSKDEKDNLILKYSFLAPFIKRYLGAYDLLNDNERYCFWFLGIDPIQLKSVPEIREKLDNVKRMRLSSPTPSVKKDADIPYLFTQIRQPLKEYIVVPETSSSNRKYIPISYLSPDVIASNSLQIINDSSLFLFGVLQSKQHEVWVRNLCGRLKNDFRYTPNIYHNFPFPKDLTDNQIKEIEEKAQNILDARIIFSNNSLSDLYDPLTMPQKLVKAHYSLDKSVDLAYRSKPFSNDSERMGFLFELYEKYTSSLFSNTKPQKSKRGSK